MVGGKQHYSQCGTNEGHIDCHGENDYGQCGVGLITLTNDQSNNENKHVLSRHHAYVVHFIKRKFKMLLTLPLVGITVCFDHSLAWSTYAAIMNSGTLQRGQFLLDLIKQQWGRQLDSYMILRFLFFVFIRYLLLYRYLFAPSLFCFKNCWMCPMVHILFASSLATSLTRPCTYERWRLYELWKKVGFFYFFRLMLVDIAGFNCIDCCLLCCLIWTQCTLDERFGLMQFGPATLRKLWKSVSKAFTTVWFFVFLTFKRVYDILWFAFL